MLKIDAAPENDHMKHKTFKQAVILCKIQDSHLVRNRQEEEQACNLPPSSLISFPQVWCARQAWSNQKQPQGLQSYRAFSGSHCTVWAAWDSRRNPQPIPKDVHVGYIVSPMHRQLWPMHMGCLSDETLQDHASPLRRAWGNSNQDTPLLPSVCSVVDDLGSLHVGRSVKDLLWVRRALHDSQMLRIMPFKTATGPSMCISWASARTGKVCGSLHVAQIAYSWPKRSFVHFQSTAEWGMCSWRELAGSGWR